MYFRADGTDPRSNISELLNPLMIKNISQGIAGQFIRTRICNEFYDCWIVLTWLHYPHHTLFLLQELACAITDLASGPSGKSSIN